MALTLNNISFKGQTISTIETTVIKNNEGVSSVEEDQRQIRRLLDLTPEDLVNDPEIDTAYWTKKDTLHVSLKDGTEITSRPNRISIDKTISSHLGDTKFSSSISERFRWFIDNTFIGKETPEFAQEVKQIFVHLAKLAEPYLLK